MDELLESYVRNDMPISSQAYRVGRFRDYWRLAIVLITRLASIAVKFKIICKNALIVLSLYSNNIIMETKICKKCNEVLSLDQFYPNKTAGFMGVDSYCKNCRKQYHRERKDISNTLRREKMKIDLEHRDKILKSKVSYHQAHIENAILNRAKQRAIKWDLDFDIELSDIIIPKMCPLLEIPIFVGTKGNYHNSPSLDRIDNSKGYTKDNIRVISTLANSMKNAATEELLYKFIKNLPNYLEQAKI